MSVITEAVVSDEQRHVTISSWKTPIIFAIFTVLFALLPLLAILLPPVEWRVPVTFVAVLIALAAGAGSLFIIHVTSNTFWLLQTLLGQTVRGALKTVTVSLSIASVIALVCVLALSLFI